MEEAMIVIMLKDRQTGFLEKELGAYRVLENEGLIYNVYAEEAADGLTVVMKLSLGREALDWEFDAIFDYYDMETIQPFVSSIEEEEECYNPTWVIRFPFVEPVEEMEKKITGLLKLHKQELDSVYEAIADQKDAYADEKEDHI